MLSNVDSGCRWQDKTNYWKNTEWPSCIAQKEIASQSVQFFVNSIITGKHLLQLKNTLFSKMETL